MQKTILKNYAKLLAKTGLNVRRGQEVIISADLDQPEFVAMCAEECYRAGASHVSTEWTHQPLTRLRVLYESEETLSRVPFWQEEKMRAETKLLPARLYIESEDPYGMAGIDAGKYARASQARQKVLKPYRDRMENRYQWCIAAVPGEAWAKRVFPDYPVSAAVEKLWKAILTCARTYEGNPIANWQRHNARLSALCEKLNGLSLTELEYRNGLGTDFRIGLNPDCLFMAGEETTLSGVPFNPNIPSEEIYTSPVRGQAEGIVYATKPLSFQGQLIQNFSVRFEKGKAVGVRAESGQEVLEKLIAMDEGASYLGECALVPFDSPISRSGVLFHNTLFDENAACHLAFGRGFTNTVRGYENHTEEELHEMGVNDSMIHVDFMIGSADLSVTGVKADGTKVPVFENGNWAI